MTTAVIGQTWVNLGDGPLMIQALDGQVYLAISASQPTANGDFVMRPEYGPRVFNTTSAMWALSASGQASVTVASATVTG